MYPNVSFAPRMHAPQLANAQARMANRASVAFGRQEAPAQAHAPLLTPLPVKEPAKPQSKAPAKIDTAALKTALSSFVDNVANLLQGKDVQAALKQMNTNLVGLTQNKDLPPVEKVKLNVFQHMMPTNDEKLAQLVQRITQGLQRYNQALSQPNAKERLLKGVNQFNVAMQSPELRQRIQLQAQLRSRHQKEMQALAPTTDLFTKRAASTP